MYLSRVRLSRRLSAFRARRGRLGDERSIPVAHETKVSLKHTYIQLLYTNRRHYQELDEVLELPALLVLDRIGLVVALEEVDSGEPLHGQALHVHLVSGVVHLCDDNLVVLCKLVTELVPDRGYIANESMKHVR